MHAGLADALRRMLTQVEQRTEAADSAAQKLVECEGNLRGARAKLADAHSSLKDAEASLEEKSDQIKTLETHLREQEAHLSQVR